MDFRETARGEDGETETAKERRENRKIKTERKAKRVFEVCSTLGVNYTPPLPHSLSF